MDEPIRTISLLVGLYTKADLPEEVAYTITKAFWENRAVWEKAHPAMKLLRMETVNALEAPIHPGGRRYYEEIGFELEQAIR